MQRTLVACIRLSLYHAAVSAFRMLIPDDAVYTIARAAGYDANCGGGSGTMDYWQQGPTQNGNLHIQYHANSFATSIFAVNIIFTLTQIFIYYNYHRKK